MTENTARTPEKLSWRFPATFWNANLAELCERAAFYGMFISLFRYLNEMVGFTDEQTGLITGAFASILYFLPTFMGIMADKIGFKTALVIAFALLTGGYTLLGAYQLKGTALIALTLIMCGGAIVKPVISGTVAKCSDSAHRARAMSIFYMIVNIGAFSGKAVAGDLNERLGLQYINFYAAGMALLALVLVSLFYRDVDRAGTGKTVGEALSGLVRVVTNVRFMCLILIVAGFWAIQGQLYSSMPTYIERVLGKGYKPEWLANINPLVVVLLVVPITHLVRKLQPASAIGIGLAIIPFTALVAALGPLLQSRVGQSIDLGVVHMHPVVLVFIIGIALQGLAECFLSPKWLEYVSKQAPPGEVGLYLGYSHLTTFFAWLFGFVLAGYLLAGFCPDPRTLPAGVREQWRLATDSNYRLMLPAEVAPALERDGPVPDAVRAALAAGGCPVPAGARLERDTDGSSWKKNPPRTWKIAGPNVTYTITESRFKPPRAKEGARREIVELLVSASTPRAEKERPPLPAAYRRAHYLWYVFTGVGVLAFAALLLFKYVTGRIDRRAAAAA